jgi:hypothetical protein
VVPLALASGPAAGNGALPDAQNVLTPGDRPLEIIIPTNFGVVLSHDAGATWLWTCEQDANALGWNYQIGLSPRHRVFTVANKALAYSDDSTCGWRVAGGSVTGLEISDAWVDRALPDRVLAIGVRCCDGDNHIYAAFESADGGTTFGAPRYVAASGDTLTGIESSVSDPAIIYMTMSVGATAYRPTLARSADGGGSWQLNDLTASLGKGNVRLMAVDPRNADKVFLLWNDPINGQSVAATENKGATATIRWQPTADGEVIKAFIDMDADSGTLLLATDAQGVAALHLSRDGGKTFEPVAHPPHIRGFSQRGATIYAATDNFADGYALATSTDGGSTWRPLMSYDHVQAIAGCVKATCQSMCVAQVPTLWSADVCSADPSIVSKAGAASAGCAIAGAGDGYPQQAVAGRATLLKIFGQLPFQTLPLLSAWWLLVIVRRRQRTIR